MKKYNVKKWNADLVALGNTTIKIKLKAILCYIVLHCAILRKIEKKNSLEISFLGYFSYLLNKRLNQLPLRGSSFACFNSSFCFSTN